MALESGSSTGGFGEWGHLLVALESEGITRLLWRVGASIQVALESVGITRSGGITRWLWRVGASPGGFGE